MPSSTPHRLPSPWLACLIAVGLPRPGLAQQAPAPQPATEPPAAGQVSPEQASPEQTASQQQEVATPQESAALAVQAAPEPGPVQTWLPQLEPRRGGTNFFVFSLVNGGRDSQVDETWLVQFRIDLSYDIARLEKWPQAGMFKVTFPFRLISFWDLFNELPGSESSPFLETNYAPGLELSWALPRDWARFVELRGGVLHESNGLGIVANGPDQSAGSRAWNFAYAGISAELPVPSMLQTRLDLMGWIPFGVEDVPAWPNQQDAGTRLHDHLGYFEAGLDILLWLPTLRVRLKEASLSAELRLPFKKVQVWDALSTRGNGFRLDVLALCHVGKGERLSTANEERYACYAGVGL